MVTKYIIMCGGNYSTYFKKPRQLSVVNGEVLVERTIRLLKENGIEDISISTNYRDFDYLGVPILEHENSYRTEGKEILGYWCDAFYPTNYPTCYIFGDVYFSEEAIKTIVNTNTEDIEFFGSAPPFATNYPKDHVEPFALKVADTEHLKKAIQITKEYEDQNKFWRKPLMWELWTVIKNTPLQTKAGEYPADYIAINDYTSDIDREQDIKKLENIMKGGIEMVKVECIVEYDDLQLNERIPEGKQFDVTNERADYLANERKLVKIIEVIPEPEKEPEVEVASEPVEEKKVEKKPTRKKTRKNK